MAAARVPATGHAVCVASYNCGRARAASSRIELARLAASWNNVARHGERKLREIDNCSIMSNDVRNEVVSLNTHICWAAGGCTDGFSALWIGSHNASPLALPPPPPLETVHGGSHMAPAAPPKMPKTPCAAPRKKGCA